MKALRKSGSGFNWHLRVDADSAMRRLLILIAAILVSWLACYPPPASGPGAGAGNPVSVLPVQPGRFGDLWNTRTIVFGNRGGLPEIPGMSHMRGGSGIGGFSLFPLTVRATWMDSTLMEAGIREFAALASMNDSAAADFRSAYYERYETGRRLRIWVDLSTTYSEEYLNLDRWSIFLEDQDGNQFAPSRISEGALKEKMPADGGGIPGFSPFMDPIRSKVVELFFDRIQYGGEPLLRSGNTVFKLVILEWGKKDRAEGEWSLKDIF